MLRMVAGLVAFLSWTSAVAAQTPPVPPGFPIPQAPARDPSQKGTASIRGHVFDAATGQPLRKAQVRAFSPELRENRLATTDANGAYELKELVAGRYQLNASKGSFVQLQYGQSRPFEPGKPLELANGQTIEKVEFSLPRGGIITGRILDEFGDPAPDVQVIAMRYQYIQGRRQLSAAGRGAMTNDIGEYRLFALPPGQYFVSARPMGTVNIADTVSDDRSGYAPTYYPNGASIAEAQRVTVAVGQTLGDINFSLTPTRLARLSGTAVDAEGKPLAGAFVIIISTSGAFASSVPGGQVRPDGTFTATNVAPGDYTLRALSNGPTGSNEVVEAKVTVAGEDINGIRLTGVRASTATGRIILPQAGTGMNLSALQLITVPSAFELLSPQSTARITDDGSFEVKVQPGTQLIRMNPIGVFANVRIKAVRLNGVDITDSGLEVRPNEDIGGLEVELTNQLSDLSGFVTNARGDNVKDYSIVVFSRDRERWGFGSRYLGGGRPDQDGRYRVRNLPAGNYFAIALDYVEQGAGTDPEFLDRIKNRATEFSLNDGETKSLSLALVTGL